MKNLNYGFICGLYKKYSDDLKKVKNYQKGLLKVKGKSKFENKLWFRGLRYLSRKAGLKFLMNINPQIDDIEAEITYLLIREMKPKVIVEISPLAGWSTTWILNALRDNGFGRLYSYDLVSDSTKIVPRGLSKERWIFTKGDVTENLHKLPKDIHYLFIDAEHTDKFAEWYVKNLFPLLKKDTIISVHDVFHTEDPNGKYTEGGVVINWLKMKKIKYFTASKAKQQKVYEKFLLIRNNLGLDENLILTNTNSMIFFRSK